MGYAVPAIFGEEDANSEDEDDECDATDEIDPLSQTESDMADKQATNESVEE